MSESVLKPEGWEWMTSAAASFQNVYCIDSFQTGHGVCFCELWNDSYFFIIWDYKESYWHSSLTRRSRGGFLQKLTSCRQFSTFLYCAGKHRRSQGAMPPTNFLQLHSFSAFEKRCVKQNTVSRLKSNICLPPYIWAGYATAGKVYIVSTSFLKQVYWE